MKRHAFWIFLSLLGLVWLLLSCDEERCKAPATVVKLSEGCYGFELANGIKVNAVWDRDYCITPVDDIMYNFQYIEGKKVLIGFEKATYHKGCGGAKPVVMKCIEELEVGEY